MTIDELKAHLALPAIVAPMFLVSSVDLLLASCKAGIVGSLPFMNSRTSEEFGGWLAYIEEELAKARLADPHSKIAPYAVNLVVDENNKSRFEADVRLIETYRPSVVITCFGPPAKIASLVHSYGGLVFHDVATQRHAEKAIESGVDGLIALTSGAGGHTGVANPFAFVPQLRRQWNGAILLAGCISNGRSILAAEMLGADFAYIGSRFAATKESSASEDYRSLLVTQTLADVTPTNRISGVTATFLRGSLERVGLDPEALPPLKFGREPNLPEGLKPWRDIWSAGQGVALIDDIPHTADLVDRLRREYQDARVEFRKGID